ncbi:hypothetical protein Bbelb_200210 [Branchiostoma belcheri]|nr:hypothetical protein Bbelb_200210 [Branchiostoma belcheri]
MLGYIPKSAICCTSTWGQPARCSPASCYKEESPSWSASSEWDSGHSADRADINTRETADAAGAWAAATNDQDQWLMRDFGDVSVITGIITKGRNYSPDWPHAGIHDQYVTSYTISYGDENGDEKFYTNADGQVTVFPANDDRDTEVYNDFRDFSGRITARFVKIHPQTWHGHISMRAKIVTDYCKEESVDTEAGQVTFPRTDGGSFNYSAERCNSSAENEKPLATRFCRITQNAAAVWDQPVVLSCDTDLHNLSQVRIYTKLSQVRVYTKLSQERVYTKLSQVRVYTKLSQVSVYTKLSQVRVYTKLSQVRVYTKLPQVRVNTKLSLVRIYTKLSLVRIKVPHLNVYTKLSQAGVYTKLSQISVYTKLSQIVVNNETALSVATELQVITAQAETLSSGDRLRIGWKRPRRASVECLFPVIHATLTVSVGTSTWRLILVPPDVTFHPPVLAASMAICQAWASHDAAGYSRDGLYANPATFSLSPSFTKLMKYEGLVTWPDISLNKSLARFCGTRPPGAQILSPRTVVTEPSLATSLPAVLVLLAVVRKGAGPVPDPFTHWIADTFSSQSLSGSRATCASFPKLG